MHDMTNQMLVINTAHRQLQIDTCPSSSITDIIIENSLGSVLVFVPHLNCIEVINYYMLLTTCYYTVMNIGTFNSTGTCTKFWSSSPTIIDHRH